jgi:hypothetical protein
MPVMDVGVMNGHVSAARVGAERHEVRPEDRMESVRARRGSEMFAFQRLMDVLVFVSHGDVQPDAEEYENAQSRRPCPIAKASDSILAGRRDIFKARVKRCAG